MRRTIKTQVNLDNSITVSQGRVKFRVAIDEGELCVWHEDLKLLNIREDEDGKEVYISTSK